MTALFTLRNLLPAQVPAGAGRNASTGFSFIHRSPRVRQDPRDDRSKPLHRFPLCVRPENRTWRIRNGGLSPRAYGQIVRAYQRD